MIDLNVTMIDPSQPNTNIEIASAASVDDSETCEIIRKLLKMPQSNLHTMPQGANILDVDLTNPQNSIFIPVNCVGVMGKGLALDFKNKYPDLVWQYKNLCEKHYLQVGFPGFISFDGSCLSIVLFPTKKHWKDPSQLHWIKSGLLELAASSNLDYLEWRKQTRNIHIPKLGCGLGGLEWSDVRPLIEQFAEMMPDHQIYLYE